MRKTNLYSLDHEQFRALISSGERGLAERMLKRHKETSSRLDEADLDDLDELLKEIVSKGGVSETEDRKTDNLVNHALWLIAEEAGVDAVSPGLPTEVYERAFKTLTKGGWLSKPLLAGRSLDLFTALLDGRIYGTEDAWECDTTTAILDPSEVRTLLAALRQMVAVRGSKLTAELQELLENELFPSLESAARSGQGLLALTREDT